MNQKGIAQIVVVLIILAGLALGVYLIGQKTFFKPKAGLEGTRIEFAGASVSGDKTTSRQVKLRAYYVPPTVSAPVGGTYQTPPYGTPSYGTPTYSTPPSYSTPSYQTPTSVSAPASIYQTPSARVQGATAGSYPTPPVSGVYPTYFNVSNDVNRLHYNSTSFIFQGNPTEVDWTLSPGNGTKTVYAEFKVNGVWGNRVSASITLAEPTVSEPVNPSARRVFITSTSYNGNLGGLAGADAKCQARANAVNLGGTWKAWLSDSTGSPSTRFTKENLPYKNLNGEIIANSWSDLTDGSIQKSIAWTELKTVHAGWVWTNTNVSGISNSFDNCSNWTVATSPYTGWIGSGNFIPPGSKWTIDAKLDCLNQARLYCFEQNPAITISPSPSPASTSKTVTYNLYPGDNFIGLPFKNSSTYPVDKFLQDTGGKCNTVWTTETSANKMYVYPKSGQITDYFSNESVLDISKLDLQVLVGGRGYFVKCSSSTEVQLSGAPADLSDWESSIRQWVGVPTNKKYISYLAAPYNNQNLGTQRVKTLDLLNKATQGTRNCTEVLTPRVICTTSGEACSISGTTSYQKNGYGNFTLRDDTGYAVKCVTELATSPSPTVKPSPSPSTTLRPSPSPTPSTQPVACSACSADINKDGRVTILDFSRLSSCFNKRSTDLVAGVACANADLNGDRVVTILDYSCLASKFNQRCETNLTTQPRVSTQVVSNNPPTITSSVYRGFFTRIVITARDVDRDNINVTISGKPANSYGPYCFGSNGSRTCYIYTRSVSGTITATASDGKGGQATTSVNLPLR